jgi:hypothetical protein
VGFYLRKSVRVGPLRFNLSKSGIGVSAGVPGLRFGAGPRGNYVHMGRGGLYYRASLPSGTQGQASASPQPAPLSENGSDLTEIESGSVLEMVDASSASLLNELNEKRRKFPFWIATLCATVLAAFFMGEGAAAPIVAGGVVLTFLVAQVDAMRRTSVLFYEVEGPAAERYQALHNAFDELTRCGRVGHIGAKGAVKDTKYHAGASTLVKRKTIRPSTSPPPRVKTNIAVPSIPVGRQTLHFFPDRILVFDRNGVGSIGYDALEVDVQETRFIETEGVPSDGKVVGQTWAYVNKKGGPDKRFKNNRELPIALYEQIAFQSTSGLNEVIQLSRLGVGDKLRTTLRELSTPLEPTTFTKTAASPSTP